ncbi:hypothetical protein RHDC3_00978 [Rhodocyclaceae bacterium]|nr:hypothetical protein RHDC3_00978 [Rhodocyclaceae bacterium]
MYFGWKPYVSVAERRKKAERAAAKARKSGQALSPVAAGRGAIARTFWGKAWCDNLERYSDFDNRLPRGRTYVRNGSVIDLQIAAGEVSAQVMGSSLYKVTVNISALPKKQWQALGAECADSIESLVELLQGRLSKGVMERICHPQKGLFPAPKEIAFDCSCPDWAAMCKHVAAVFYGIGARLDEQPELLFTLRRVDAKDLVAKAGAGLPLKRKKAPAAGRVLGDASLADVFGIEMAAPAAPAKRAQAAGTGKKPRAVKKAVVARKSKTKRKTPAAAPARAGVAKASATKKKVRSAVSKTATRKKP